MGSNCLWTYAYGVRIRRVAGRNMAEQHFVVVVTAWKAITVFGAPLELERPHVHDGSIAVKITWDSATGSAMIAFMVF